MDHEIVYRIEPEMSCGFASTQEFVPGKSPTGRVAVRPIQMEFDAGAEGAFVSYLAHEMAIPELVKAWQDAGMTGFHTEPMVSVPNPVASEFEPTYQPSAYAELVITGGPDDDLCHATGDPSSRVTILVRVWSPRHPQASAAR